MSDTLDAMRAALEQLSFVSVNEGETAAEALRRVRDVARAALAQPVSAEPVAWLRVSNISGHVTGVFEAGADGSAPDVQLRTERLEPLYTAPPASAEPVAWRDHVEQRLRTWQQSTVNRSGDRLALDDFMGKDSLDDLIDYVCDEWAEPVARLGKPTGSA